MKCKVPNMLLHYFRVIENERLTKLTSYVIYFVCSLYPWRLRNPTGRKTSKKRRRIVCSVFQLGSRKVNDIFIPLYQAEKYPIKCFEPNREAFVWIKQTIMQSECEKKILFCLLLIITVLSLSPWISCFRV